MKILVIEDEKKIASFVRKGLEEQGFIADVCHHGDDGYHLAATGSYDAMVIDIMLPGRDGLSILKNIRQKKINTPVLLLTARSELNEKLEGLNLGADDYLTKPFYVEELVARLHALGRRASGESQNCLTHYDLSVDLIHRIVRRGEDSVELTVREFALLEYLLRSPGRVYTRTQICEHVWNYDFDPGTNIVDVYVQRIRKKIDGGHEPKLIETVRGVGYRIKA